MSGVCNAGVTIWHKEYDANSRRDTWTPAFYPRASWYAAEGAAMGAQGETAADSAVIRLFTRENIPLAIGDMAVRGDARETAGAADSTGVKEESRAAFDTADGACAREESRADEKTGTAPRTAAEIAERYPGSVKVLRVRDNRRGSPPLRHWRIEGE